MSVLTLYVDEVMRTLSDDGRNPFVVNDKEVDVVRFALNTGFTDVVLDEHSALRVMYQRPGESQVRAQTLTYYDTDGLRNYYDWQLLNSDLAKKGTITCALCILRTDSTVEEWHTTPYQIRVLGSIHTDDSDEGDETITPTVAQRVAVLESMIQRVASGAPIVVTSASAMTETDRIYVLTTDGKWYYYDGSAWTAGGEYGGVLAGSITTDKLANKSVTTAKLDDSSITRQKLAPQAVHTAEIADGAVTKQKIADGVIPVIDPTFTQVDAAADAIATGNIKINTDKIISPGKNIFNYIDSVEGYTLKNDGSEYNVATGYTSNYIPVFSDTQYHKRYGFKSANIADVVFYDENKTYIDYVGNISDVSFTTPSNCKFIRITGKIDQKIFEVVELGAAFTGHEYYRRILSPGVGGEMSLFIHANSPVIFDSENKQLITINDGDTINFRFPRRAKYAFTSPITINGNGTYLYFDYVTRTFALSDSFVNKETVYLIGAISSVFSSGVVFKAKNNNLYISGYNSPVLFFDLINRKVKVSIPSSTYFAYDGHYSLLTKETYEIENLANHFVLWFDLRTKKIISGLYANNINKPYLLMVADVNNSCIQCSIPYVLASVDNRLHAKKITTYGDSLTWYDGNAFTWGAHQGEICNGYQSYLKRYYGATITNRGKSGYTTPRINEVITSDTDNITNADYIIIMPSVANDDRLNVSPGTVQPIGGTFDTTTTAGALQNSIEYIYSLKEDVRIVIMVEPMGFTYVGNNYPKLCNELLPATVRNVAKLYGLPCIDLWENSGINALTRNSFYADPPFEDGNVQYMYHPNNEGWERLSRYICKEMEKI